MKKRFAAILLTGFLLLQGQYGYAVELVGEISTMQELVDMGILEADFLEGKPEISRGEFTSIAVNFYGRSTGPEHGLPVSEQYFEDVNNTTTPYADIINTAAFLGIVEGYEERPVFPLTDLPDFKPNQAITAAEAVTMLLQPQGYDRYAYYNGGYPDGYMAAAAQYNLLPGVQADDSLTREQAVELLIRALPVYCLTAVNSIDEPEYVIADGTETLVQAMDESYIITLTLPAEVQGCLADGQDIKFVKDLWLCYRGPLKEVYDAQQGTCSFVVEQ